MAWLVASRYTGSTYRSDVPIGITKRSPLLYDDPDCFHSENSLEISVFWSICASICIGP